MGVWTNGVTPGVSLERPIAVTVSGALPTLLMRRLRPFTSPMVGSAEPRFGVPEQSMSGTFGFVCPDTVSVTGLTAIPGGLLVPVTLNVALCGPALPPALNVTVNVFGAFPA